MVISGKLSYCTYLDKLIHILLISPNLCKTSTSLKHGASLWCIASYLHCPFCSEVLRSYNSNVKAAKNPGIVSRSLTQKSTKLFTPSNHSLFFSAASWLTNCIVPSSPSKINAWSVEVENMEVHRTRPF